MNPTSQARLQLVHPVLSQKAYQLEQMLSTEGIDITVAQGLRTWTEQNVLFSQGRTLSPDGSWAITDIHKVVTNAQGGYSWHNYGLAIDVYPENLASITGAAQIDWNPAHPVWKRMEAVAVSLGFESGANWIRITDAPHLQMRGTLESLGAPNDDVRALYKQQGLISDVWEAAGIKSD